MELAVDAAQSRHLPGFLERFAERAARMLSADWCAVMVFCGRETDSYQTSNDKGGRMRPGNFLIRSAKELGKDIVVMPLEEISPDVPASKSQWSFSSRSLQAMQEFGRSAWYARNDPG